MSIDTEELEAVEQQPPFEIVEVQVYKIPDSGTPGLFGGVYEWQTEDGQEWTQARCFVVLGDDEQHEHFNSDVFTLRKDCDVRPHSDDGHQFPVRVYTAAYIAEQQSEVTLRRYTMSPNEKSPNDMLGILRSLQSDAAARIRRYEVEQGALAQQLAYDLECRELYKKCKHGEALENRKDEV